MSNPNFKVTGCSYSWDEKTNHLTLKNPVDNVSIIVIAQKDKVVVADLEIMYSINARGGSGQYEYEPYIDVAVSVGDSSLVEIEVDEKRRRTCTFAGDPFFTSHWPIEPKVCVFYDGLEISSWSPIIKELNTSYSWNDRYINKV